MEVLKFKTPLESKDGLCEGDLSDSPVSEEEITRYKEIVRSLLVTEDDYLKSLLEAPRAGREEALSKLEQQRILLTDREMRMGDTLFSGARSVAIEGNMDFGACRTRFLRSRSLKPKRVRRFI